MLEWWFIPVNIVLGAISGSIIGFVVVTLVKPPYPYFKFSIIQIAIGNIGNILLVLIAALCRDKSNPFGDANTCSTQGTAYISFGQWVGAIILHTYVLHMFVPPPEGTFDLEDANLLLKSPQKDASPEHLPLLMEEAARIDSDNSKKGKFKTFLVFVYDKLKLKQILQPLIIASILAMVIGAVPVLKRLMFTSDAPLYFFIDSCIILREAMIPCILLALGGKLVDGLGPGSARIGLRTLVAIIFTCLCLVPAAGLGIVMLADKLGFLPGAVANLSGCGKEAAAVLFWVHVFAVFVMAGWIILYLNILF